MKYDFKVSMSVRGYECDPQGIVNNAVYLNYLEHARSEWLKTMNLNYAEMCKNEQYIVVNKFMIDFKYPLRFNDEFWVGGNVVRPSDASLHAQQDIYRDDGKNILLSKVTLIGIEGTSRFRLPQIIIDTYPIHKS